MRWRSTRFACCFLSRGLTANNRLVTQLHGARRPDVTLAVLLVPLCFCRYTGAACEFCLASFYPSSRSCTPQYISGRTIFDPVETSQAITGWALTLLIMGALLAAVVLATMAWTLWQWLVHGVPPKTQLNTALRKARACWPVAPGAAIARRVAAVSKKLHLGDDIDRPSGGIKAHKEERTSLLWEVSSHVSREIDSDFVVKYTAAGISQTRSVRCFSTSRSAHTPVPTAT